METNNLDPAEYIASKNLWEELRLLRQLAQACADETKAREAYRAAVHELSRFYGELT